MLMHTLTVLFALLLLNRVYRDAFELRSELVVYLECVLFGDRLLDSGLRLRHLALALVQVNLTKLALTLSVDCSFAGVN